MVAQDERRKIDRPAGADLIDDLDLAKVHFQRGVDRNGRLSLLRLDDLTGGRREEHRCGDRERLVHTPICTISIEVPQAQALLYCAAFVSVWEERSCDRLCSRRRETAKA